MDFEEIVQRVATPDNPKIRKKTRRATLDQGDFFIQHQIGDEIVPQRAEDGYINATYLCQAMGKRFHHYYRLKQTTAFIGALSLETHIRVSNLVQIKRGRGDRLEQGTWVHPQVATNLALWLSPKFAVQVSQWVLEWYSRGFKHYRPVFIQRFLKNRAKIPPQSFSMLNELYLNLVAPLEEAGVVLPENLMPDISMGMLFSKWLRKQGIDPNDFPSYDHEFLDHRPTVKARLYPLHLLPDLRAYFNDVWLPTLAQKYFAERIPEAVPYLDRITALPVPQSGHQRRLRITRKQVRRSLPATRS